MSLRQRTIVMLYHMYIYIGVFCQTALSGHADVYLLILRTKTHTRPSLRVIGYVIKYYDIIDTRRCDGVKTLNIMLSNQLIELYNTYVQYSPRVHLQRVQQFDLYYWH